MAFSPEAVSKKLTRAFRETFPDVERDDWSSATQENTPGWDSFATLTLLTTIEQSMNVRIGLDKIQDIRKFDDIYALALNTAVTNK